MEYDGSYGNTVPKEQIENFHIDRLTALANHPRVDLLLFETIPCSIEAVILSELTKKINSKKPIIFSFSCKNETQLCNGDLISETVQKLNEFPQVIGVGVNCSSPKYISSIIQIIKKYSKKEFIIAYPNSGEGWNGDQWITKDENENNFLDSSFVNVKEWIHEGANIIGGCCRTTPKTIKAICDVVHEKNWFFSKQNLKKKDGQQETKAKRKKKTKKKKPTETN